MQFQTTTAATTQIVIAVNMPFKVTVSEPTINAFCDCCPNRATGTKDDLRRRGWLFGNGSEFCPDCD
jgi:hypothetical protein